MKNFANEYDWKWKLQLFAEGDGGDDGGDGGDDGGDGGNGDVYTKEQVEALLKKRDEDFDKKFNAKFAEMQKKHQTELNEAKKLEQMTAEEKAKKQTDDLRKEIEKLKTANAKSEMMKSARSILSEKNIVIGDGLLESLVTTEAETTKANVEQFADAFNAAVTDAVKKAMAGNTPEGNKGGAGKGGTKLTKEEILKVADPIQRQKLMAEHLELFR